MPDEKKKEEKHPETNFLPPLDMILTFYDKIEKKKKASANKNVEKLIEKLSEKDDKEKE